MDSIDGISKCFIDTEEEDECKKNFQKDTLEICFESDYTINGDYVDEEELADEVEDKVLDPKDVKIFDEQKNKNPNNWLELNSLNQVSNGDDNVIFSYINVMKNIVNSYEKVMSPQKKPLSNLDKFEEKEKEKDIHKDVLENISKIIKFFLILIVILFNYYIIRNELFLRIFAFVALSNDTKKSLISQNVNNLTLCLKRW